MRKSLLMVPVLALVALLFYAFRHNKNPALPPKQHTVLCTTFPIYQLTRNVTQGRQTLDVGLLLPSQLGCPHDYALTPQDLQKVAKAEALVINGLGMEEFTGTPIKNANNAIKVIDTSEGITETLFHRELETEEGEGACRHCDCCCHHKGVNPHLFASPLLSAKLALNIAKGLGELDPVGAAAYQQNAQAYGKKMQALADDMKASAKRLKNNRVVQPHGVFDYVFRDMGIEILAEMQPHGQEPSASQLVILIKTLKDKKAGAIITEPQYSDKVGKTLAKESGVPFVVLDPGATGPDQAPLDYFETLMRQNLRTLESTLGVQ